MSTLAIRTDDVLTEDMLARFDERAAVYDRENRFFDEDFEELKASGYLTVAVPTSFGGGGLDVAQVVSLQRRLAYVAPATAIAVNMHLYWTGVAAELHRSGDHSFDWLLERTAAGDVFAAGHGEAGNDLPLMRSSSTAERVPGGWRVTGRKVFGTLSPVWTYLGVHAEDRSDPANPQVIHAFLPRDAAGYRIEETWDTLGMRATQSHDTVLEGAFIPDELVPVVCPAGFAGAGAMHGFLFAWAAPMFAGVYAGIADRAYDLVVAGLSQRHSVALTRSLAHHPEVQHEVAEMRMDLDVIDAVIAKVTGDWVGGVDHGDQWGAKLLSAKYVVTTKAFQVVDRALELTGGAGIFRTNRLERLFRDARLGRIHPPNTLLAHELIGKFALGVDLTAPLRWG